MSRRTWVCTLIACLGWFHSEGQEQEKATPDHQTATGRKHVVGYLPEWSIYNNFYPKNLVDAGSADKLTHILYAFANLPAPGMPGAGTCQLGDPWADYETPVDAAHSVDGVADEPGNGLHGNFHQLLKLKKQVPGLKLLISIGGWSWSSGFSAAASTEASRKALVSSCLKTFIEGNFNDPSNYNVTEPGLFDGIDIDWEYPGTCGDTCAYSSDDSENFTSLLAEFRHQLDGESARTHKQYELSIAAPAGSSQYTLLQLNQIAPYLNYFNLMTYDLNGPWTLQANHAAPLFTSPEDPFPSDKDNSVEGAVAAYLAAGVSPSQVNVGIPFYGHGWTGVPAAQTHGLYQPAFAAAPDDQANYNVLQTLPGFSHHYDPESGFSHWIYNEKTQTFYSYDDAFSAGIKAAFVQLRVPGGLGGVMFWDLSGDDANGTLVKAIAKRLNP